MEEFLIKSELIDLQSILQENNIHDFETLEELVAHPDDMKIVVTSVGTRLKLKKKYRQYVQANKEAVEDVPVTDIGGLVNSLSLQLIEELINTHPGPSGNNAEISIHCMDDPKIVQQNTAEPPTKKRKIESSTFKFSVESILEDHPIGKALLKIGKFYKKLTTQYQSMMVDIIVCELLRIPQELPDKLRNMRTIIRSASHLGREVTTYSEDKNYGVEETAFAEKSKVWLVHNRESTEVSNHWNLSYVLREIDLDDKKYANIEDILNNWPILKESKSFELIEKDFDKKYHDASSAFILEWDTFFPNLLKYMEKKVTDQDSVYVDLLNNKDTQLQPDSKTAIQFHLISKLMAPKSNKTRQTKIPKLTSNERSGFWKPSIAESREGFILHVKVAGDIENRIRSKKATLLKKGLHLQPIVIAVGDDLTNITKSYIRFESSTYELPSLLKAIDVLFKIYLVFNLVYPLECENFCYLIQWGVYKIRTKSDSLIPFVFNTLNKLKTEEK